MAGSKREPSSFLLSSGAIWAAALLALVPLAAIGFKFASMPVVLRVAVGPESSADARLMMAASKQLAHGHSRLRMLVVPTEGPAESAGALDQGKVDLAVVRSDAGMPDKGSTVLVVHKDAAILVAPAAARIRKVTDLAKKRVGIVRGAAANSALLDAVLTHYGVAPGAVTQVALQPEEVATAVEHKIVDAIMIVSPLAGSFADRVVSDMAPLRGPAPVFLDIADAEAMSQRQPIYEKSEIVSGSFRGHPSRPTEAFTTLGVTYRLVASQDLAEGTVAELAKELLAMRKALESDAPLAVRMEAPETDKGSAFPLHPGAAAFYDNDEKSFMDRYGDWIYVAAMLLGGLGSALAALFGAAEARARRASMALVGELIEVKEQAHREDHAGLVQLESVLDDISTRALSRARRSHFNVAGLEAFRLAIEEARLAILARSEKLERENRGREDFHGDDRVAGEAVLEVFAHRASAKSVSAAMVAPRARVVRLRETGT